MKIVSFLEARVVWGGPMENAQPENGARFASMMPAVAERYNFQTYGLTENNNFPAFQHGELLTKNGPAAIAGLEMQPAGFVVLCNRTDTGDALLKDLYDFLCERFGFRKDINFRTLFRSSIVSHHEFDLDSTVRAWADTMRFAYSLLDKSEQKFEWKATSLRFNAYVDSDRALAERVFVFEKRAGVGAGPGMLFSAAPLETSAHVALLEKFDANFSKSDSQC